MKDLDFSSSSVVVGAVGKCESRGFCGICKRGGKVGGLTFPRRVFSTARRAVILFVACHHRVIVFSLVRLADIHHALSIRKVSQSTLWAVFQARCRCAAGHVTLSPWVIRFGLERL